MALSFVNQVFLQSLFWAGVSWPSQPPVEGDQRLVQLVLDAQEANLASFSSGDLRALIRLQYSGGRIASSEQLSIRLIWSGEKAFWEGDFHLVPNRNAPEKEWPKPMPFRMVFDGSEYTKYLPAGVAPGDVTIFAPADFHNRAPMHVWLDQRPSQSWSKSPGGVRPWAQLLGPHPKLPSAEIEKWVIRQDGERVISERHNKHKEGDRSVATIVASLDFAGNVIETNFRSKRESANLKFEWRRDEAGRVILNRVTWQETSADIARKGELVISDFQVDPIIAADQFETKALMIRNGATVEDLIRKRKYTYAGRLVDQKSLDGLGKKVGAEGLGAPKK